MRITAAAARALRNSGEVNPGGSEVDLPASDPNMHLRKGWMFAGWE